MSEAERDGAPRQDESGRLLAGRYRLGGVLGRGGMGTVWRAKDETLGRTVAVKELRFPSSIDEDEKRRLITRTLREAKAIARIRNNGAVTVFDVVDEDDRPWIVMELIEGKSLAEAIREDGLLEPKRAAEVGLAILDVLRAAHREGILHRDVKPSNVLIAKEDGRVVLTDFGIAQVEGDPSITSTGMLVGAPSYISPERARGHKPGPAADLWSLGGLLYASIEGVPPYDKGSAIATLTAVMTEPVPEPKCTGPLRDAIFGLLTKDPERRLDEAGARALLTEAIHAPAPEAEREQLDATRVVALPSTPETGGRGRGAGTAGAGKDEQAEGWRGTLRSVRRAAAGAGAATAGAAARDRDSGEKPAGAGTASTPATGTADMASGSGSPAARGAGAGAAGAGAVAAAGAAGDSDAARAGSTAAGGRTSGWPEMSPPDLPPRPAPSKTSITDVVPRRALVIIAVALALAVLGTVLALTLGDDGTDGSGTKKNVSDGVTASTGTDGENGSGSGKNGEEPGGSAGSEAAGDSSPGTDEDTSGSGDSGSGGSGKESGSGSGDGDGVEKTYKSGQGFSIGLPKGWKYESTGAAGARFNGPGGQKLLVGWTSTPKDDPVADWKNQERYMTRADYRRIRIEAVEYRGWNTADWEFTYTDGGTGYRSIDRGFVVNSRQGYALMYTAKASEWSGDERKDTWKTFTGTFEPKS